MQIIFQRAVIKLNQVRHLPGVRPGLSYRESKNVQGRVQGLQGVHRGMRASSFSPEQKWLGGIGAVCYIVCPALRLDFLSVDTSLSTFLTEEALKCGPSGRVTGPCAICMWCQQQMDPGTDMLVHLILDNPPPPA